MRQPSLPARADGPASVQPDSCVVRTLQRSSGSGHFRGALIVCQRSIECSVYPRYPSV